MNEDEDLFEIFQDALTPSEIKSNSNSPLAESSVANNNSAPLVGVPPPPPPLLPTVVLDGNSTAALPRMISFSEDDMMRPPKARRGEGEMKASEFPNKADANARATPSAGLSIIRSIKTNLNGSEEGEQKLFSQQGKIDPHRVFVERRSGIRLRRATFSFEQLPLFLAQFPFISFEAVHAALFPPLSSSSSSSLGGAREKSDSLARACIGVVLRRSPPRPGAKGNYAILSLWNLGDALPLPLQQLSFLLCGAAFDSFYTQLSTGVVVAVGNLSALPTSKSSMANTNGNANSGGPAANNWNTNRSGGLLKLADSEQMRVLGYAVDLGGCTAVNRQTGEECGALVNTQRTTFCGFHTGDLQRAARGNPPHHASPNRINHDANPSLKRPALHIKPAAAPGKASPLFNFSKQGGLSAACPANSRAGSLKCLREATFFAVRGATGLPVARANALRDSPSSGGIYAGVRRGNPLPTVEGTAPGASSGSPIPNGHPGARANCRRPCLPEGTPHSRGLELLEAAREQDWRLAEARWLRGEPAEPAPCKRPRDEDPKGGANPAAKDATVDDGEKLLSAVRAIQNRFTPLKASRVASFTPLSGVRCGGEAGVVLAERQGELARAAFQRGIITRTSGGRQSALVSAAAQALKAKGQEGLPNWNQKGGAAEKEKEGKKGTLLGKLSEAVRSAHDGLREEADHDSMMAYLQRQAEQEKARAVLEGIAEQRVMGIYCHPCGRWYTSLPTSCAEQHHRTERRETVKSFVQCEQCGYKTGIIGEGVKPWRVMPRCPRCQHEGTWERSNAAPELAAPRPDPHCF